MGGFPERDSGHAKPEPDQRVPAEPGPGARARTESLAELLGGRGGAIDATLPPLAFAAGWLLGGESLWGGVGAALAVGAAVAGVRLSRGDRPRSVLIGLLAVCVAALIAVRTGRAEDFFLIQVLSNAASALAWAVSIIVRWPLLGVLVGAVLGQRTRWRRDRALRRAYGRASWVWTATYVLRLAVFVPLYLSGQVLALVVARVALTWPLVAAALALSWVVLRRSLPDGHPGLRHPVTEDPAAAPR
ncbi:putative membrane protein [Micromonospora luteifusca]|uniref:Membrane protein n=1 Tax=Micromonospora luteifusca TaxID=709860 RepID=A0ABS2LN61_9ACTN|nr:putative membrane protein [Micromonospora luteifusca]